MALSSLKKHTQRKTPDQYSRLERLLAFNPFSRGQKSQPARAADSDFIDIVLDADYSHNGKVKNIK